MESLHFYMLVGLPGSGKSTWIKSKTDRKYAVVSSDDIIERIAKEQGLTYSDVFQSAVKTATKEMEQNFKNAMESRDHIIWDQTNLSSKKRKGVLSQLPKDYKRVAVVFQTPMDVIEDRLVKRAKETGKHIPKAVVLNMLKSFEIPTVAEGFDDVIFIK
jgi:predicted kinase